MGPCTNCASQQTEHHSEKWCKLIEVSVPAEKKKTPKKEIVEIARMWGGSEDRNYSGHRESNIGNHATPSLKGNLNKILKNVKEKKTI